MERAWVSSPAYRAMIAGLVAVRTELGVGQRELARRLGKHPSWLNKVERLERRLDVAEFVAVARALQVAPQALMAKLAEGLPQDLGI